MRTDAKKPINKYTLEEIEALLQKGPITIKVGSDYDEEEEDYDTAILRNNGLSGYICDFYHGNVWTGAQSGGSLVEMLLLGFFGYAHVQPQVIDAEPSKALQQEVSSGNKTRATYIQRTKDLHYQRNPEEKIS